MAEGVDPGRLFVKLRSERERQGLTLEWVADKVGVKKQSISEFETDTTGRKRPTEETLRKWLDALHLPDDWADEWVEFRIEEEIRRALESRRGPRAMSKEDIEAITRIVRRSWGRG